MSLKVATQWYERRQVATGLFHLWEPHVHGFARCNIWYIQGRDRDLLIDSGTGLQPLTSSLPVRPSKPIIAAATHCHFDHIGCHHEFGDCRVHEAEAEAYATMPDEVTLAQLYRDMENPVTALPHGGWTAQSYVIKPAPVAHTLADGDVIDLGDRSLTVLHLPGHSPGSLGFFDERHGLLFSGDALYDGGLIDDFPSSDIPDYCETMDRLKRIDIARGFGGHGPDFDDSRKLALIDDYLRGKRKPGCPAG